MARSPDWKVYSNNSEYRAACKYPEDAAALVAFLGDGTTVRFGHDWIVWTEGQEDQPAIESYDRAVDIMRQRVKQLQCRALNKAHGLTVTKDGRYRVSLTAIQKLKQALTQYGGTEFEQHALRKIEFADGQGTEKDVRDLERLSKLAGISWRLG